MAVALRDHNRRLAVEQLEHRRLLDGDPMSFDPHSDFHEFDQVGDVHQIVSLNIAATGLESEFAGLSDASSYSQIGLNWVRLEAYWKDQSDTGQDWDAHDERGHFDDQRELESRQNHNDDTRANPSGDLVDNDTGTNQAEDSSDNDTGTPVDRRSNENAASDEGGSSGNPLDHEDAIAGPNSDNPVPAAPSSAVPVGAQTYNASPTLPTPIPDQDGATKPAGGDDARNATVAKEVREQSNQRERLPDAGQDQEAEPQNSSADDALERQRSPATLDLQSGTEQIHDKQIPKPLRSFVTRIVGKLVPRAGLLVTAGISRDFAAMDTAMNELLDDLEGVRSDATAIIEDMPIPTWALSATVGLIAAEIVRRRRRHALSCSRQDILDDQLAVWMYPECSGLAGMPPT